MSGNPAFQNYGNAFQPTAFQAGVMVVAGDYSLANLGFVAPSLGVTVVFTASAYSLGPLDIATPGRLVEALQVNAYSVGPLGWTSVTPGFNYHFSAAAYSLGALGFATPALYSGGNLQPVTANPYSLASPTFDLPSLRQDQAISVKPYSLGALDFAKPAFILHQRFFANTWATQSPAFATPLVGSNYQFTAPAFAIGALAWTAVGPIGEVQALSTNAYSLQSPRFACPRLQWTVVDIGLPPPYRNDVEQAADMLIGMLDTLMSGVPPSQHPQRDALRVMVATLRNNAEEEVRGTTLGTQLDQIFKQADLAGITFAGAEATVQYLFGQSASKSLLTQYIFRSALVMAMALECKVVARTTFKTRDDAQAMIVHMTDIFEQAKMIGIDDVDVLVYQTLTAMGGAIINHLSNTGFQLPRFVAWQSKTRMPSLYLAQRIYADASRSDEIEDENGIINPCFVPMNIRVLSEPPVGPR
jgi:hypothetical protein